MKRFVHLAARWGTLLTLVCLPVQTRWLVAAGSLNGQFWEYGTLSLYATSCLMVVVALVVALDRRLNGASRLSRLDSARLAYQPLVTTLAALVIWSGLSLFWAGSVASAATALALLLPGVLLAWIIVSWSGAVTPLLVSFLVGVSVQSLLGYQQLITQAAWGWKWLGMAPHLPEVLGTFVVETPVGRWLRAYGGLPHPNILAAYAASALVVVVGMVGQTHHRRTRLACTLLGLLAAGVLVGTFSRAGWLAAGAGGLVTLGLSWRSAGQPQRRAIIVLIVSTLVWVVVLSGVFREPLLTRWQGGERLEVQSTTERVEQLAEARSLIAHHPLVGVGVGNYTWAVYTTETHRDAWQYQPVHNFLTLVMAELGLVGALLILLTATLALWSARHRPWLVGVWVVLLTVGLFDHFLWSLAPGVLLWWLALGFSLRRYD